MDWTKTQLKINYRKTLRQAGTLERLAEQMLSLADGEIEGNIEELDWVWEGENGGLYARKGRRLHSVITQHAKALLRTALVLKRTAENTYRAELKAIELMERWF